MFANNDVVDCVDGLDGRRNRRGHDRAPLSSGRRVFVKLMAVCCVAFLFGSVLSTAASAQADAVWVRVYARHSLNWGMNGAYVEGQNGHAMFSIYLVPGREASINGITSVNYQVTSASGYSAEYTASLSTLDSNNNVQAFTRLNIPIIDDEISEADGKITVTILPGSGYKITHSYRSASARILDDDTPTASFASKSMGVQEGSSKTYTTMIELDRPTYQDVTVNLKANPKRPGTWSATAGTDFNGAAPTITATIPTGQTSAFVSFASTSSTTSESALVFNDTVSEEPESFTLAVEPGTAYKPGSSLQVTIFDDEKPVVPRLSSRGEYIVPENWPLIPQGLNMGDKFRLLFATNDPRNATSTDIAVYDAFVQAAAAGSQTGGAPEAIKPYANLFKAVGSTSSVHARDHIDANPSASGDFDGPIYWMNGPLVASNKQAFWSSAWENWDASSRRTPATYQVVDLTSRSSAVFTGTETDGTGHANRVLGTASPNQAAVGAAQSSTVLEGPISSSTRATTDTLPILGISPVFLVEANPRLVISETSITANEPAACAKPANDVAKWGGITHEPDLVTWTVALTEDPGQIVNVNVRNPHPRGPSTGFLTYIWEIATPGGVTVRPTAESQLIAARARISNRFWHTIPPQTDQPTTFTKNAGDIILQFGSGNWNVPQKVSLNVHCANHQNDVQYRIKHRLLVRGAPRSSTGAVHHASHGARIGSRGDYFREVKVTIIDADNAAEPANLDSSSAYEGTLKPTLEAISDEKGFRDIALWCRNGDLNNCEWLFGVYWNWERTVNNVRNPNDWWDAQSHFKHFRVTLEGDNTLSPALTPYSINVEADFLPGSAPPGAINDESYGLSFTRTGLFRISGSTSNPGDPVYRITITPVTIRNNDVPGEAVTLCVQLQSPGSSWHKWPVIVDCSTFSSASQGADFVPPSRDSEQPSQDELSSETSNTLPEAGEDGEDGESSGYVVDESVVAAVQALAGQTHHGTAHVNRWQRALAGLGVLDPNDVSGGAMTAAQAQQMADSYSSPVWDDVVAELTKLEADPPVVVPVVPVVSITGGAGVTEGGTASFTVTASPAPLSPITVKVGVSESGSFGASGAATVTVSGATTTYTVTTTGDDTDEADGSVTVTVKPDTDYTVSTTAGSATVTVSDDDDPPPVVVVGGSFESPTVSAHGGTWQHFADGTAGLGWAVSGGPLELMRGILGGASHGAQHAELDGTGSVTISQSLVTEAGRAYTVAFDYRARPGTPGHTNGLSATWNGADIASGVALGGSWQTHSVHVTGTGSDTLAFSDAGTSDGVGTFLDNVSVTPVAPLPQAQAPVVGISGGSGVTEGGAASFTITASPAPSSPITVKVGVSESGSFGASGAATVTVSGATTTYTVTTADDQVDEADGTVTATLKDGSGYTVSATAGSASVDVADDDDPPPVIPVVVPVVPVVSITGGSAVTEGGTASFTVTASPAPSSPITVKVGVSESGSFGASGPATVTLSGETTTYTVTTTDDQVDEADGTVTATLKDGSGYTVSATAGSASVEVADDDDPPPPPVVSGVSVSLSASTASVPEADGEALVTITLSRALENGEWVQVPLAVTGGVEGDHWTLVMREQDNPTGGAFQVGYGENPAVLFFGGGRSATLLLTALPDDDTTDRELTIAVGSDSRAPTSGGIDGSINIGAGPLTITVIDDD